ncbi:helix-turn-helix domain-containing protein [Kineococcus sp. SYSU DK006]|uniref:helix-turn-helix domain-containing protein n=1 Tax=Kineococcus sp. SYSU DK006 TaxID=3383127 RepID=UPI003D7E0228
MALHRTRASDPSVEGLFSVQDALEGSPCYRASDAAEVLGVHLSTVYRWMREGVLQPCAGEHLRYLHVTRTSVLALREHGPGAGTGGAHQPRHGRG